MSDSDWGWLTAGAAGGASLVVAFTTLIKSLKADPNKQLDAESEKRRLELTADEQEAQQAERAVAALMDLLKETRSMLREERQIRREWQDSAEALHDSNEALRDEVASLRAEVAKLSAEVSHTAALRKELAETKKVLDETNQILDTYRAKYKE